MNFQEQVKNFESFIKKFEKIEQKIKHIIDEIAAGVFTKEELKDEANACVLHFQDHFRRANTKVEKIQNMYISLHGKHTLSNLIKSRKETYSAMSSDDDKVILDLLSYVEKVNKKSQQIENMYVSLYGEWALFNLYNTLSRTDKS